MKYATIKDGFVIGVSNISGVLIPKDLWSLRTRELVWDSVSIVDAKTLNRFAIGPDQIRGVVGVVADTYPVLDCSFDDALVPDGDTWRVKTDEDALSEAKAKKVLAVQSFASDARATLAGTKDPAKFATYNQRAGFARLIEAGNATDAMIEVAKSEAVRTGLAADLDSADAIAMAQVWIEKDGRLAKLSAEMDATESQIIAAINAASSIEAVDAIVSQSLEAAAARVAEEAGV